MGLPLTEKGRVIVVSSIAAHCSVTAEEALGWLGKLQPIYREDVSDFPEDGLRLLVEGAVQYAEFVVAEKRQRWIAECLVALMGNHMAGPPFRADLHVEAELHVDRMVAQLGLMEFHVLARMRETISGIRQRNDVEEVLRGLQQSVHGGVGGGGSDPGMGGLGGLKVKGD